MAFGASLSDDTFMAEQSSDGSSGRWERDLTWGDAFHRYEVLLREDDLLWVWVGPKDMGGATEQRFVDYLADGPREADVPLCVRQRLDAALEGKLAAGWEPLRREARALRAKREAETAERKRENAGLVAVSDSLAAHDELPRMPEEAPAPRRAPTAAAPLWKALALGVAVYIVGVGGPVLVTPHSRLGAGFLVLFLPVLAGFGLSRWNRGVSTVVAGFFGLAGGIALVLSYGAALAMVEGELAALASVAEAPAHATATRFTFADARLRPELRGEVTGVTFANESRAAWVVQVAPLVPAGWTPAQPVPAFAACDTTPGFDCLGRFPVHLSGAVLFGGPHAADAARAVELAVAGRGLTVARGAPLLAPVDDPGAEPKRRWVLGLVLCALTWLLWAGGVIVAYARAAWSRSVATTGDE